MKAFSYSWSLGFVMSTVIGLCPVHRIGAQGVVNLDDSTATTQNAGQDTQNQQFQKLGGAAFQGMFGQLMGQQRQALLAVQVKPTRIAIDATTRTVTVTVVNTSDDTLQGWLRLQDIQPRALGTKKPAKTAAAKDSLAHSWSLVAWVHDLPGSVTLAPYEKRTITLHLSIPAGLATGTYTAYLVVRGIQSPGGQRTVSQLPGNPPPFLVAPPTSVCKLEARI